MDSFALGAFGLGAFDMATFNRTQNWSLGAGAGRPASLAYFCASTASAIALAASSALIFGLFTKDVTVSRIAPRYFCRMVMLWAIERTSIPSAIEACKSFCDCCWQGLKSLRSMSSRAGIEPLAWLNTVL